MGDYPSTVSELKHQAKLDSEREVFFTNIDNEEFSWTYQGQPFSFKPHQTVKLPYPKAILFRKHLIEILLTKKEFEGKSKEDLFPLIIKWQ